MVERTCGLARRFAQELTSSGRAKILNDVVFNQVLVQWQASSEVDVYNDRVIERVQREGAAFFSGTTANGMRMMRISVSDWATDDDDVDRAVAALLEATSSDG